MSKKRTIPGKLVPAYGERILRKLSEPLNTEFGQGSGMTNLFAPAPLPGGREMTHAHFNMDPLPSGWTRMPLSRLFESRGGATPSKDNAAYWGGRIPWVSPKDMKVAVIADAEDHVTEKALEETRLPLFPPPAVLIVVRGMILAHTVPVALTSRPVTINQDMKALFPRPDVSVAFLLYMLQALGPRLLATVEEAGHGTQCLRMELWRGINVAVPPKDVQDSIVGFIERKTRDIDQLIAKKHQQIELLELQGHALVNEAVVRGLNENAPKKASGIEWLGEIPFDWKAQRLKFLLSGKIEQGWSPQCDNRLAQEDEWGVLKVGCVNGNAFDPSEQKSLPLGVEPERQWEILPGDILMSRGNTRELVGSAALVRHVRPRLLLCDLLYRFRVDDRKADHEFVVLALRSSLVRFQIEREATGTSSSMKKIGQETIKDFVLYLPPLQEQREIVAHLRGETERIDRVISRVRNQMECLREYRQAVITAAVTGQIEPRPTVSP